MHTYSESELTFIKSKFQLNDIEMDVFMSAAHRYELNPLANQIYPQLRTDRKTGSRNMVIATGIDGYRTLADRTGHYAGNDDPIFDDADGPPKKATVFVYKIVGGVRCAFSATARWEQYVPGENMAFMWRKMPHLMLGKVAEALALRKAFPAAMSGIYTVEEMEQAGPTLNTEETPPATSQVKPPAQRAVPSAALPKPKAVKPKAKGNSWDPKKESPKEAFVRLLGEWTGYEKSQLMDTCKRAMTAHGIVTDGKAEPADFLCLIDFCEKYSENLDIDQAIELVRAAQVKPTDAGEEF